ncbi:MAG: hypothetical protein NTV07_02040, partial [Candidatus Omnitrophica bacterium]|nr:hypothetical protein [Candidatus Omnitrophota bacterium]
VVPAGTELIANKDETLTTEMNPAGTVLMITSRSVLTGRQNYTKGIPIGGAVSSISVAAPPAMPVLAPAEAAVLAAV